MGYNRCETVRTEMLELEKEIVQLEAMKRKLPKGELICSKNTNRYKWFVKEGGAYSYLPKAKRELAEKLAIKKYLMYQIDERKKKLEVSKYYLKKMEGTEGKAEALLLHEEWGKLLEKYFQSTESEVQKWQNEKYSICEKHEEGLIHKGTQGKMLRSKSEVIIDMMLYENHIPFRYEEKLILGGFEMYPDFTIRHPRTGKIMYWEHFGLMDNEEYRNNVYQKIRQYCDNGIIPSIHLITTYETKQNPLSTEHVRAIIKEYF